MKKVGLLLNNIGTPESFSVEDVKRYLTQFLMDPGVISVRRPWRDLLVRALIVPFRSKNSAKKYEKIWLKEGSPLMVWSKRFADGVQRELGPDFVVRLGMAYGTPSLQQGLNDLTAAGVEKTIFVPMFPQWAEATTGSAIRAVKALEPRNLSPIREFYAQDFFIHSQAEVIDRFLAKHKADHVLFSYHSLPESQIQKKTGCLTAGDCCLKNGACEKPCYRAQCLRTSELLAQRLKLPSKFYSTSFQSRLGPSRWIGPSTVDRVQQLSQSGVKHLAVACPSFVADCLETAEEIGLELRQQFLAAGGMDFHLIPCLNDDAMWVQKFSKYISSLA